MVNPEDESRLKRRKGDNTDAKVERLDCKSLTHNANFQPFDILISESFVRARCPCTNCEKLYSKIERLIKAIQNMSKDEKSL